MTDPIRRPARPTTAPRRWLVKEEPSHFSFADLERAVRTEWDSVHNPLAQRNLRSMRRGEPVLYYHTGSERAVVGIAEVADAPHPDPGDPRGAWAVAIRARRPLRRSVPLERLKREAVFEGSSLVRIGRLSVVEITGPQWERVLALELDGAPDRARNPQPHASGRRRR
ncbi:MAG: EVE domain-containing protein [Thermoplasmata archaeon]|nr:EVE domain-containing protein [Thermoplasmata archaeon]MCI4358905.1 EVE domain-containing protein [Thermoplasmata archaeon]